MVAAIAEIDAVEGETVVVIGETLEATRNPFAGIDGVVIRCNQLDVLQYHMAERAGMEGADTHLSTPFLAEIVTRHGTQPGLYHGGAEQRQADIDSQKEKAYETTDYIFSFHLH